MLTRALEDNSTLQPEDSSDPAQAAADMEYSVFSSIKSSQTYKLRVNDRVKEIKSSTKGKVLHSSLRKCFTFNDAAAGSLCLLSDGPSLATGFVKASELVSAKQHSRTVITKLSRTVEPKKTSGKETSGLSSFVPASKLLLPNTVVLVEGASDRGHKEEPLKEGYSTYHGGVDKLEDDSSYKRPVEEDYSSIYHGGAVKLENGPSYGGAVKLEDSASFGGPITIASDTEEEAGARGREETSSKDELMAQDGYNVK